MGSSRNQVLHLEGGEDSFGRMAKGIVGMAEIIYNREVNPWSSVEQFKRFCQWQAGVALPSQTWSVVEICCRRCAQLDGHRTLQKLIAILAHGYELAFTQATRSASARSSRWRSMQPWRRQTPKGTGHEVRPYWAYQTQTERSRSPWHHWCRRLRWRLCKRKSSFWRRRGTLQ